MTDELEDWRQEFGIMSLEEANAEFVRNDPLRDFFVLWDEIDISEVERYTKVLERL